MKRKQKFLAAIFATVGLAAISCTGESVERPEDDRTGAINFVTRLGGVGTVDNVDKITRAAVVEDPAGLASAGGFDVWAMSHPAKWATDPIKTPLLDGVHVSGTVGGATVEWSYDAPVKWPEADYVSFFAYGPWGTATIEEPTEDEIPVLSYTVPSAVSEQHDLLIATPVYDQLAMTYPGGAPVHLMFNHALSRIVLSGVAVNAAEQEVKVKSVDLVGLHSEGTVALGDTTPDWEVKGTAMAYYSLSVAGGELADVTLSATSQNLTTGNGYLFLMPQSLEREPGQEVTLEVVLNVDGKERSQATTVFYPTEWLPGKSYNYQLVVGGDDLKLVLVSIEDLTLVEWDVEVMIQPVPLVGDLTKDQNRLYSALDGMGYANIDSDHNIPSPANCQYFAIYLMNEMSGNITIDMTPYDGMFTSGENVIFDGKKIVNSWVPGSAFSVTFNDAKWELAPSRQGVTDPMDASSGATTLTPNSSIDTYGSVRLIKLTDD